MSETERQLHEVSEECQKHFDSFAIVVRSADENNRDYILSMWNGPWSDIMGLVAILNVRAQETERRRFSLEMDETILENDDDL